MHMINFPRHVQDARKLDADAMLILYSRGLPKESELLCPFTWSYLNNIRRKNSDKYVVEPQQRVVKAVAVGESPLAEQLALSLNSDLSVAGSECSPEHLTSELRIGNNAARIFMNESKGISLESAVVADLLEE